MTRSAARSPAAQRAMAAETFASIALSAGASVVIGCRPAGILREGPLRANVIPATAGAALWMQPAQLSFTQPSASVVGPLPYPDWSQSATAISKGECHAKGQKNCDNNPPLSGRLDGPADRTGRGSSRGGGGA